MNTLKQLNHWINAHSPRILFYAGCLYILIIGVFWHAIIPHVDGLQLTAGEIQLIEIAAVIAVITTGSVAMFIAGIVALWRAHKR